MQILQLHLGMLQSPAARGVLGAPSAARRELQPSSVILTASLVHLHTCTVLVQLCNSHRIESKHSASPSADLASLTELNSSTPTPSYGRHLYDLPPELLPSL